MNNILQAALLSSSQNVQKLSESEKVQKDILKAVDMIAESYKKQGGLFAAGNGGSAADAQHFVAELVSKLNKDRTPIKAFALTVDTSILTAVGNDYGYEHVFSRQVLANMNKNDIFFAITTSGNSPNILMALKECKNLGISSILLSGRSGGEAAALADHVILAPGEQTNLIQECHLIIEHILCYLIEKNLVDAGIVRYVK